jgi:hypothetical protein
MSLSPIRIPRQPGTASRFQDATKQSLGKVNQALAAQSTATAAVASAVAAVPGNPIGGGVLAQVAIPPGGGTIANPLGKPITGIIVVNRTFPADVCLAVNQPSNPSTQVALVVTNLQAPNQGQPTNFALGCTIYFF